MPERLVAGWTDPLDFQLKKNGSPFNGTGMTPTLEVTDARAEATVTFAGTLAWLDATQSTVRFTPASNDLVGGKTYNVRVKVVDSGGKVAYFPKDADDQWLVRA